MSLMKYITDDPNTGMENDMLGSGGIDATEMEGADLPPAIAAARLSP